MPEHPATIVAHADWSVDPRKRWVAIARREAGIWHLAAPVPVGDVATFPARLRAMANGGAVALGVDLPLGLPRAYAALLPERDFPHFLTTLATRPDFFQVCTSLAEVGLGRPFYPARGVAGMTRAAHALALGFQGAHGLSRACDRATAERPAGAPLFWTLGANQSGKAAIAAWRDMLLPNLASGRRQHPAVAVRRCVPRTADARQGHAGGDLSGGSPAPSRHRLEGQQTTPGRPGGGGGSPARGRWRRCRCSPIPRSSTPSLTGFGSDPAGEDRFDCILGVLCVLNVLAGNRPDTAPADTWIRRWEGWVLGQTALPRDWPVRGSQLSGRRETGDKERARPGGRAKGCSR